MNINLLDTYEYICRTYMYENCNISVSSIKFEREYLYYIVLEMQNANKHGI